MDRVNLLTADKRVSSTPELAGLAGNSLEVPPMSIPRVRSHGNIRESYLASLGYIPVRFQGYLPNLEPFFSAPSTPPYFLSSQQQTDTATSEANYESLSDSPLLLGGDKKGVDDTDMTEDNLPIFLSWLKTGSIKGGVFNLCSATLGAGALSLPIAFSQAGIITGTLLLMLGAVATIYSIHLLLHAAKVANLYSYEDLAVKYFGKKFAIVVEVSILLFCFGTCVAYIVAAGDILHTLANSMFPDAGIISDRTFLMCIFVAAIMFPLSLIEEINSLRYSSLLGVMSIVYLVIAIMINSIMKMSTDGFDHGAPVMFNKPMSTIQAFPVVMFAFTCQTNVYSIYCELVRPTRRRMNKVVHRSVLTSFMIYIVIGIFGYLQYEHDVAGNILKNLDIHNPMLAAGEATVTLTVILAFPLNIFPTRFTIEMMFFTDKEPSRVRHFTITILLVGMALLLAIYVPSINVVFSLLGSTTSAFVCYVVPAMFGLAVAKGGMWDRENLPITTFLFAGIIVGVASTSLTILELAGIDISKG
eukprot:GFYU01004038.1.p1 GENE.GFYU01004038.1~~GFYU01004038.1.p1  ORF type:complete len:529 (+),score=110.10 GFYU01004038.1:289-1875(+)